MVKNESALLTLHDVQYDEFSVCVCIYIYKVDDASFVLHFEK